MIVSAHRGATEMNKTLPVLYLLLSSFILSFISTTAHAVPGYARQTGMSCAGCHTTFPELNAFGRQFKLTGYTLTNTEKREGDKLSVSQFPPISVMVQANLAHSKANDPQTEITLPDQLSLFLAGRITPDLGSFIQLTLEQESSFAMDNAEIRFAKQSATSVYGVTLNNSPTVQDLWNSTPVWGYPWTGGAGVTSPIIADGLGQNVAGIGAFARWDNGVYAELTFYRETNGFDAPAGGVTGTALLDGASPYWRLAWENQFNNNDTLMIGAYGIQAKLYDGDNVVTGADEYTDVAIDTQYEHPFANSADSLSIHATYTNEKQTLGMSSSGNSPTLNNLRVDGTYHRPAAAASLAFTQSSGDSGAYDDEAMTIQVSYLPWENTKYTAQYTAYNKIGGVTSGVSDNDTLLLQAWLMW
jgi:hypothetical protein